MISVIEPTAPKGNAPIYQLKAVLRGSEPPIWRRLQVPGDANLGWLHAVLQVALGWTNSHLHQSKLLKTLANPKHPEHQRMKEWLGRPFDAEAFDVAKTNLWLRRLKWPRVTEAQLRKVLMGRDGCRE